MKVVSEIFLSIKKQFKNRIIFNVANSKSRKKALLSYIVWPFKIKGEYNAHTNFLEAKNLLSALSKAGFAVDVCSFDTEYNCIDYNEYDLIIGFGIELEKALKKNISAKTILYATGTHFEDNLTEVKKSIMKSGTNRALLYRLPKYNLFLQNNFTDAVIYLGEKNRGKLFNTYNGRSLLNVSLPLPFEPKLIKRTSLNIEQSRHSFVWFGSNGIKHKGLDILIDFFSKNSNYKLYICGDVEEEIMTLFDIKEINKCENIIYKGFVDIQSKDFNDICGECLFTILPSCSEGIPGALVNPIALGGLIPISTESIGLDIESNLLINDMSYDAIKEAVDKLNCMTVSELIKIQIKWSEKIYNNYNEEEQIEKISQFIKGL
ncbi:glycosyltransferase [Vibrio fluvialis]|uniref:glycosyltransferase n=1 Tax=Vibrio fluvialis TaxID=676 RepID=UPI002ACA4CFD|nr:glycosyltransferase [Vibrio fluvialis]MDZ5516277.1 glycosyltransferase [Vibrio fluvialis]